MVSQWAVFLKDLDLYIGSPFADVGDTVNRHPAL